MVARLLRIERAAKAVNIAFGRWEDTQGWDNPEWDFVILAMGRLHDLVKDTGKSKARR